MKHLTDNQLIQSIENLVRREREMLHEVLLHFRELDRRKLYSKLGFTSLFDYATKHLKYSPDQAGRRIAAMRVLREVPEAESKVIDGSLTLSSLAQAHWHFNKVEHSKEEKREILSKLENATKKQTQVILKQEDKVRFSFEASEDEEKLIERLRELNPHLNFNELMIKVCKLALEKIDPANKINRAKVRAAKNPRPATSAIAKGLEMPIAQSFTSAGKVEPENASIKERSRYIPAQTKRDVWQKAEGKCENCKSTFAIEYDHILPVAKGGQSTKENLRLLCRSCNQRSAIEHFGIAKMSQYLRAPALSYLN